MTDNMEMVAILHRTSSFHFGSPSAMAVGSILLHRLAGFTNRVSKNTVPKKMVGYTHSGAKRNRFIRISSEIFGIFKKPLVEIFEIRNKFSRSKKLRNQPWVET